MTTIQDLHRRKRIAHATAVVLALIELGLLPALYEDGAPLWFYATGIMIALTGLVLMAIVNITDRSLDTWNEAIHPHRKSD